MSYNISCSSGYAHPEKDCTGVSKFTASYFIGLDRAAPDHTVEVEVTFDPETKQWTATIVKQYEGRF